MIARLFGRASRTDSASAEERFAVASQLQLTWWRFRRHKLALASGIVVILFYLVAAFVPSVAVAFLTDLRRGDRGRATRGRGSR